MSLLSLQNVSAFYGPSQALFDVSLSVGEGEVVAPAASDRASHDMSVTPGMVESIEMPRRGVLAEPAPSVDAGNDPAAIVGAASVLSFGDRAPPTTCRRNFDPGASTPW